MLHRIARALAVERLRVRSALNPMLWLCAIVTTPSIAIASCINEPPIWLIVIACVPVVLVSIGFLVLLFFDRGKLQSEVLQMTKPDAA